MCLVVSNENNMFIAKEDITVYKQLDKSKSGGYETPYQSFPVKLNSILIPEDDFVLKFYGSKYQIGRGVIHAYTEVDNNNRLGTYFEAVIKKGTKFWIQDDLKEVAAEKLYLTDKIASFENYNKPTNFSDYLEYGVDVYLKDGRKCKVTDSYNKKDVIGIYGYDDQVTALNHSKPLPFFVKKNLPHNIRVIDTEDLEQLKNELENSYDGYCNTKSLRSLGIKSPVLDYCDKLGENWYIPSSGELKKLFKNQLRINITLQYLGKPTLGFNWFWSSDLNSAWNAWTYYSADYYCLDGFTSDYLGINNPILPFLKLDV